MLVQNCDKSSTINLESTDPSTSFTSTKKNFKHKTGGIQRPNMSAMAAKVNTILMDRNEAGKLIDGRTTEHPS